MKFSVEMMENAINEAELGTVEKAEIYYSTLYYTYLVDVKSSKGEYIIPFTTAFYDDRSSG